MTLSDKKIQRVLKDSFVCGWQNIQGKPGAGASMAHDPSARASQVNNGSGFHNVQMFVLTPDGHVAHCLPGYWEADALLDELRFGVKMARLWNDGSVSAKDKMTRFTDAHLTHVLEHPKTEIAHSSLPHFDQAKEQSKKGDTTRTTGEVKKADQIVHERMAERPFLTYEEFDTARFTDVGQKFYDAHNDG